MGDKRVYNFAIVISLKVNIIGFFEGIKVFFLFSVYFILFYFFGRD